MRQGDGSDLLGQSDPRNADIGILYVGPEDSRQEILTPVQVVLYCHILLLAEILIFSPKN